MKSRSRLYGELNQNSVWSDISSNYSTAEAAMTGPDVSISAVLWVPEHYKSAAALAVTPSGDPVLWVNRQAGVEMGDLDHRSSSEIDTFSLPCRCIG